MLTWSRLKKKWRLNFFFSQMSTFVTEIACVANVSMQFRSNENEEQESNKQSKTARKMAQVKEWGGVRKKAPSLPPPFHFLALVLFLTRSHRTKQKCLLRRLWLKRPFSLRNDIQNRYSKDYVYETKQKRIEKIIFPYGNKMYIQSPLN